VNTNNLPWDKAGHIKTKDDVIGYLEAALEEKDTRLLFEALGGHSPFRGDGA
jgi:DNA-binding phage protein